jgi:MFS family permease
MMAAFGLGGILGALLAAVVRGRPDGREVRLLATLTGLAILGSALAPGVGLALAGLVVTGCLSIWFIARANTLVQLHSDPAMRGRVMGIWTMALPGAMLVTGPATGLVAQTLGARVGFGLAGAALLMATGIGWRALAERAPSPAPATRRSPARPAHEAGEG